jgi:hypothetical protein
MLGRLRSFVVFVPVALLVLVLLLWARSYLPDQTFIKSNQGRLIFFFVTARYLEWFEGPSGRFRNTDAAINYCQRSAQANARVNFRFAGFEWTNLNFKSTDPGFVAIPYWALAAGMAALSLWAMLRRRSQRERLLPGHCIACGYDLRASHEKCPECGVPVPVAQRTEATSPAAIG